MSGPASTRVPRTAALTAIGLLATGLVRFGGRWASESLFGVEGLALLTVALSVSTIAIIPGAIGMSAGTTKLIAEETVSQRGLATAAKAVWWGMASAALGAVVAYFYVAQDRSIGEVAAIAPLLVALMTVTFAAYTVGKSILFGFGRVTVYSIREGVGLALFATGAAAAWAFHSVELLVLAVTFAYLPVGLASIVGKARPGEVPRRRALFGYAVVGTVGSLAGIGFTATTPLVASAFEGLAGVALIGAILTVLEPLNLAPRAVGLAILPDISRSEARSDGSESADTLKTATGLVAAAALPICFVLLLERDRVLGWVFSADLVGGATLGWFAMAFMISVIGAPAVTALAASNLRLAGVSTLASVVGFSVAAVTWATLGDERGITAIAMGYFVGSLIQVGVPVIVASKRFAVRWAGQWLRIIGATAVAAVLATQDPSAMLDVAAVAVGLAALSPELRGLLAGLSRKG